MPAIATAQQLFGTGTIAEQHAWLISRESVRQRLAVLGVRLDAIGQPGDVDADATPATAYVNQGRWVADCPQAGCGGALALVRSARGFLCGNCLNVACGSRYRPLVWPADRDEIEDVLAVRLLPEDANWSGESVEAIKDENEAHGVARSLTAQRMARGR